MKVVIDTNPDLIHIRPRSYFADLPTPPYAFRIGNGAFLPIRVTDSVVVFKFYDRLY